MTQEDDNKMVRGMVSLFMDAILKLIQEDPHQWSTRPCSTCRTITSMIDRPFGCDKYRMDKEHP